MKIKKISAMDHYEILNLEMTASQKDIENAYILAIATFHKDSLASYGLISENERSAMLEKIEEAFATLSDAEKRKIYDSKIITARPEGYQKAFFRKSTQKLQIEDAEEKKPFWKRMTQIFSSTDKKKMSGFENDESSDRPSSLYSGEFLKKVREHRGLSLQEMAKQSKIRPEYLEAIEAENHEFLPKGKSLSSLIKLYIRQMGFTSEGDKEE